MRKTLIFLFFLTFVKIFAQTDSSSAPQNDIFIIDSYITPETPHKLVVSFSTSDSCTSIILLKDIRTFVVSNSFTDNHKIEIELIGIRADSARIKYQINARSRSGIETQSEEYEVEIPKEIALAPDNEINWTQMCIGGLVYAIPSLEYVMMDGGEHLGLSKEIPLWSFYSQGYNYPQGYIGIEYSHYLNATKKNFMRLGYKHMFQSEQIKYIATGLSVFGDFKGYNGLSAEVSLGLFQIQNVFTLYTRYRYNFQLQSGNTDFYEFSLGLYANIFSFNF
jgi:hypothetical protein